MSVSLPWEITIEILWRLPIRSLAQFKCVSKSFYNLISNDPIFKKKYLNHQSNSKKVILVPQDQSHGARAFSCSLSYLSPGGVCEDMSELKLPISLVDSYRFHNSYDGLFCIGTVTGDVIIWNPLTGQAKRFPGIPRQAVRKNGHIGYSLAHDSRSNVYKLLGIYKYVCRPTYRLCFYSAQKDTPWRYVQDDLPCNFLHYGCECTIVNGAFHWPGSEDSKTLNVIVSLDISDETYTTFGMPRAICDAAKTLVLCVLKGKLSVFCQGLNMISSDIWVMKEYGVVDSMTKMFSISLVQLIDLSCWPLYMLEDDTIVIYKMAARRAKGQTAIFKDGKFLRNVSVGKSEIAVACVYFESLISPHEIMPFGGAGIKEYNPSIEFTMDELKRATNSFNPNGLIRDGTSTGSVYKGILESTGQIVEVKKLDPQSDETEKQYVTEIVMLRNLQHPNIVNLIGHCSDGNDRILVYESMPLGSLFDHLHAQIDEMQALDWNTRMKIAIGVGEGLGYLQNFAHPLVIWKGLKSSNILLGPGFHPKIANFRLAKFVRVVHSSISNRVIGTPGYRVPECASEGYITFISEVYSYGVFLLEIVTGLKAYDVTRGEGRESLVSLVLPRIRDESFADLADPKLRGEFPLDILNEVMKVALMCIRDDGGWRPVIGRVLNSISCLGYRSTSEVVDASSHSGYHNTSEVVDASSHSGSHSTSEVVDTISHLGSQPCDHNADRACGWRGLFCFH